MPVLRTRSTYTIAGKLAVAWDDIGGQGVSLADSTILLEVLLQSTGVAGTSTVALSDVPTVREVVIGTSSVTPFTNAGMITVGEPRPLLGNLHLSPAGVFRLDFNSLEGKTYGVYFSSNLVHWSEVASPVFSYPSPGTARWFDDGTQTGGLGMQRFYRIKVN